MKKLRYLLLPFSIIFYIIVFFRNKFYDLGFFKQSGPNSKIISVGNVSSGGTGKTPLVEVITRYLLSKNKFVVIISKGYKRVSDDIKVAEFGFDTEESELTSENFGDEGLMLLEDLHDAGKGLLVIADKKRSGAKFADSKFNPDVIVVDDAFQHRKLTRDLDAVLVAGDKPRFLLPAGNYREPVRNVSRADIVLLNRKFNPECPVPKVLRKKKHVTCDYVLESFINIRNETLTEGRGKAVAFCGIADPDSFKDLLIRSGFELKDFIVFPDHHYYEEKDIDGIIGSCSSGGPDCILTTRKDFIRIKYSRELAGSKKDGLYNYPLYYAKIKMQFSMNGDFLFNKLDELVK